MALAAQAPAAPATPGWLGRSAAVGLGVAMAAVLALTGWLFGGVSGDLATQQKHREALLVANAVTASLAGAPDGAAVGERVARWQAEHAGIESVRVIAGRELLASPVAADEAPRNLQRDEKPLFDLANELRAAVETNTSEGVVRRKTIQVDLPLTHGAPVVRWPGSTRRCDRKSGPPAMRGPGADGCPRNSASEARGGSGSRARWPTPWLCPRSHRC